MFEILETSPVWREPWCKRLKHRSGLIEVKVDTRVAYRILGFTGPERFTFKIMLICNHKGRVYDPPDAIRTAARRKKEVETGKGVIRCARPI